MMSTRKTFNHLFATLFTCSLIALSPATYANEAHCPCPAEEENAEKLAHDLVNNLWENVQHQNVMGYSRLLAPTFKGLNINGHYCRQTQIDSFKNLTIKHFKIKDL